MATPEYLTAIGKAQVETALRFTEIAAEGVEKLTELNLKTARTTFEDGIKNVRALVAIKDVSELPTWTAATAQPGVEKATSYLKSVYETSQETASELHSLVESQFSEFGKQVDSALKSAPAGSEAAVSALKSALGVANTVYENVSKANKQFAAVTEANLSAATAPVVSAKKKAA